MPRDRVAHAHWHICLPLKSSRAPKASKKANLFSRDKKTVKSERLNDSKFKFPKTT